MSIRESVHAGCGMIQTDVVPSSTSPVSLTSAYVQMGGMEKERELDRHDKLIE